MTPGLPEWVPQCPGPRPRLDLTMLEAFLPLDVWCDGCGQVHPDRLFVTRIPLN